MTKRRYNAEEQQAALKWLVDTAMPALEVLALRGQIDKVALEQHKPALDSINLTLEFLKRPWVIEALMKGPPR